MKPYTLIQHAIGVAPNGDTFTYVAKQDSLQVSSRNSPKTNGKLRLRANPFYKKEFHIVYVPSIFVDGYGGRGITYNVPTALGLKGPQTLVEELVNDVIGKVSYKWRQKAQNFQSNLAAMFAERKSCYEMIYNNLKSLVKAARYARKGNAVRAWKALGVSPRSRKFASPDMSGRWLELQYGWLPLIGDMYTIADAEIPTSGFLRCSAVSRRVSVYREENSWNFNTGYRHDWNYSIMTRATCAGFVEFDAVASAAQFGLTNPALVAWEVIPFSFVVDWFLPVGDYLEGLTALHGLKLTETSLTVHRMVKGTSTFTPGPASVRSNFYRRRGHTTYDQYLIERTLGLPSLPLPKLESPFSVLRGLNAIALLRQLLRG